MPRSPSDGMCRLLWVLTQYQHLYSIRGTKGEVSPMNPVERVLHQELMGLLDRLATTVPDGALEAIRATNPNLKARLDDTEAKLAALRATMLDDYGRWRRGLEDLENLLAVRARRRCARTSRDTRSTASSRRSRSWASMRAARPPGWLGSRRSEVPKCGSCVMISLSQC